MRKSNKILAVLLALVVVLTAIPSMTAMAKEEHTHAYVLQDGATEATCTTDGQATYKCDCGDVKVAVTKAKNHDFTGDVKKVDEKVHKIFCQTEEKYIEAEHVWIENALERVDATCTEAGKKVSVCICGATKEETIEKVAHVLESAHQTEDGKKHVGTCITCLKDVTVDHVWADVIVEEAKCKKDGLMKSVCICGATKEEAIPQGHTYGNWKSADDKEHAKECSCGETVAEAHKFVVTVTKKATCVEEGSMLVTCEECNYVAAETIAMAEHEFGDYSKYSAEKHQQKCKECEAVSYGDHNWDAGVETKAPTCKEAGVKTYTCADCKATKTEEIAKTTEHTVKDDAWTVTKEATCAEAGSKEGKCSVCEAAVTEEIAKTNDHKWGEWEVTKNPTILTKGEETRVCEVCKAEETRTIDKVEDEEPELGDVNGDGEITAIDARLVLQHVAGLRTLNEAEFARANVNGDKDVTAMDARKILQIVAGLDK